MPLCRRFVTRLILTAFSVSCCSAGGAFLAFSQDVLTYHNNSARTGLNSAETEMLQLYLEKLSVDGGLTLLVVEHDMHFVGALCQDVVVLSFGKKIAEGSPDAIR